MKKVYYVVKSELHYYPPCVSQIKMLRDLGVDVTVVYGSSHEFVLKELNGFGIKTIKTLDVRGVFRGKIDKVHNWLKYRASFKKAFKKIDPKDTVLWFGNVESFLPLRGIEKKFECVVSFLELTDEEPLKTKLLAKPLKMVAAVTSCELNRAYIMKCVFGLKKLPYVFPNKPYGLTVKKNSQASTDGGKELISRIGNRDFILFQGLLPPKEFIEKVAYVLKNKYQNFVFVLMGLDRYKDKESITKQFDNVIYADYIPAPLHLEITSRARIGLLYYEPYSMNQAFCAPNKIYEYSAFGVPMIGNSIPGLINTIKASNAGICIELDEKSIDNALDIILKNYDFYSKNALDFYNKTDNFETMSSLVKDLCIKEQ